MPDRTRLPRRGRDAITTLALRRVATAPPHQRLLAATGLTVAEYARRLNVSRQRLQAVFAQAEATGRISDSWAERFALSTDTPVEDVRALFARWAAGRWSRRSSMPPATTTARLHLVAEGVA